MLDFVLVEAPTLASLVPKLNDICRTRPKLKPHGYPMDRAGRVMQVMVEEVEYDVPAGAPYVTAYCDGISDDESLGTKVARLLWQGYVLWGPQQGNEYGTWQVMVARSAIGGGA